ncbi:MAG: TIGR03987 family protein [Spirochaetales bacterium]|nr:TIGR03987 family protein [Spirochaetales bacterium]
MSAYKFKGVIMFTSAIIFISLALVFYSAGVWGEKISGKLKPAFLILFWAGLIMDTTGTAMMTSLAGSHEISLHTITGVTAILLMILHALWATMVLIRKDEKMIENFHRFSLIVWIIWLIPYLSGLFMNM